MCSCNGAGVVPETIWPNPSDGRSSASASDCCTSAETATPCDAELPPVGGAAQEAAADDVVRGAGVAAVKSDAFTSVSVQPPPARTAALVASSAAAAALSKSVADP